MFKWEKENEDFPWLTVLLVMIGYAGIVMVRLGGEPEEILQLWYT